MFDKLVLSSVDRRQQRTGKFFFVTSLIYSLVIASALVVSVVAASPVLYEKVDVTHIVAVPPPPPPYGRRAPSQNSARPQAVPRPDIYHPERLDQLMGRAAIKPIPNTQLPPTSDLIGNSDGTVPIGDPYGVRNGIGPIGGNGIPAGNLHSGGELPPPPVQKPVEKPQPPVEKTLVKLTSTVLTGKAIERKTPTYPPLARQVHVEGAITVEIVISADGRVESARALGGHPLLMNAAVEAARGWRFQPTLLNGTAVRVTGVITFNFKLD